MGVGTTGIEATRRQRTGGVAALAGLVCLLACASSSERRHEIRSELIGQPATILRGCLGDPHSISVAEGHEEVSFRWKLPRDTEVDHDTSGLWGRRTGPWIPPTNHASEPGFGYCEVFFGFAESRIAEVRAVGKTADGLDAELRCLEIARRCVPDPASALEEREDWAS